MGIFHNKNFRRRRDGGMPRYCAHWFRVSNLTKSDVKKRGAIISFSFLFLLWRSRLWSLIGRGVECMRHFCFLACNSMDLGVLGKKFENMADIAQNFGRKKTNPGKQVRFDRKCGMRARTKVIAITLFIIQFCYLCYPACHATVRTRS